MSAGGSQSFDVAVIGAGIAGASVAAELADAGRSVALLERESQPGYHTTGRSAALFSETYGPAPIRALSRASARFYDDPPAGFSGGPLLTPRGVLMVARADQLDSVEAMLNELGPGVSRLDGARTRDMVPLLREDYAAAAVYEEGARDIDVHGLHHGYLRRLKAAGGVVLTDREVLALERDGGGWRVETRQGSLAASLVVNAAGAWADEVGAMAGAMRIGLQPKRRTAMILAAPEGVDPGGWPMAVDIDEEFYLKADAGRLLVSPADETPSPPCDAQADEYDVAVCVERIEAAFDLHVARIENRWAGLRSFVADRVPVAGFDAKAPGFFWLAGQGGYGIQSAPALARAAAGLVLGRPLPGDIAAEGVTEAALSPSRPELAR